MVRSHFWSSASYLCIGLTGLEHPWYSTVDSATGGTLSSGRHGVGAGCTSNVPDWRAFGLGLPVNEKPYRMVGAAIGAGLEALKGARGWAGTAATFVACVIPLLPYEAEVDPRLWERGLPFPDAFRLPLPWCLRLEPRRRQRRIFFFQVSNIEPSASCVANSGLRRAKTFIKGAGHHRRLCSVDPQLQQRPLYCIDA